MGTQNNGTDDWERKFHGTFLTAANMFSNLYGLGQQRLKQAFEDGERHGLENLRNWILDKGPNVTAEDIIAYIQNEIYNEGFPQPARASQHHQAPMHAPAPHNPIMPYTTPTAAASSTVVGNSQQNYVSFYHGASQHHQAPMHALAPHNPIMPYTTPTAAASSTVVGNSQQNYVPFYHGESAAGHRFHGDGQGYEMETDAYFPEEVTGHWNQSNSGQNSAPTNSKQ